GKLSSSIWSWSGSCIRPTLGAPRLRSFTTSPCLGRRLLLTGALLLGLLDRLAQRLHEVHHLRRLWRHGGFDDLAFDLGLHDLHHRLAVVVLAAARVEGVGQALDQRLRHLELLRVALRLIFEAPEARGTADPVRPVARAHHHALP